MTLPDEVTSALDRARVAHPKGDRKPAEAALELAFVALDFPGGEPDRMFPLADALTPAQRALAEVVIDEGLPCAQHRLPGRLSARRWIGLDPPGPVDTPIEHEGGRFPIWSLLRPRRHPPACCWRCC